MDSSEATNSTDMQKTRIEIGGGVGVIIKTGGSAGQPSNQSNFNADFAFQRDLYKACIFHH